MCPLKKDFLIIGCIEIIFTFSKTWWPLFRFGRKANVSQGQVLKIK